MSAVSTVTAELQLRLVVPGGPSLPVLALLHYAVADPWAVSVTFHTGGEGDGMVEWLFARELLTEGVARPSGQGDVRVWPADGEDGPAVNLAMASPSGSACFELDRDALVTFLQQTYLAVPTGSEESAVDLDAELSRLLGD